MLPAATWTWKIEEYFDKRYEIITGATTMSYMDMGLMANTEYSYRVRAAHGDDAGMWSETAMVITNPGVPQMVAASADSAASTITVTWMAPAGGSASAITGYMVQRAYEMADGTMSPWMAVDPAHMDARARRTWMLT